MDMKIGLALSGGGAKGLAHIGVLKVLEEHQVPVHLLAGTSMGGIIAALYAAGRSAVEIEHLARSLRLLDILQRDGSGTGLIGREKLAHRLREELGGERTFDQLEKPLALTAADLNTGEQIILREGSVIQAVMATMAVPVLFSPVPWQGRLLADGGLLNQVPFDVVREMDQQRGKTTRVIAVHTLHDLTDTPEKWPPLAGPGKAESIIRLLARRSRWAPMVDVIQRSYSIISRQQVSHLLEQTPPDLMIEITLKGIGLLDLDRADYCIAAGEEAARQHLPAITELKNPPSGGRKRWWRSWIGKNR